MASSTAICGICDLGHITKPSVIWCSECDEGLCSDCKEHHSLSKSTRKHNTIPITEYQSLPKNVMNIREYCEEHQEKLQLFCKRHDCACCRICAVDRHSKCEDVTTIEKIIQNAKKSDTFYDTEYLITEMLESIDKIRKNRRQNLSSVQQQKQIAEKEILAARTKINNYLDQIQETLMKELVEVETNEQQQTTEVLTSLDTDENQLNFYQTTMASIKQYATDLQTFLSMRDIERGVADIDKYIQLLLKTDTMNNTFLSYQIDKIVKQVKTNFPTHGNIIVQRKPCEITISRRKYKQAQIMVVPTHSRSIENITLKLQQTVKNKLENTRGCVLLPDGRMIFSCYKQHRVISINKNESQNFDTGKLSVETTFDLAYIEDTNTIAVTSDYDASQCISIIDIRSGHFMKTIPVKSECYGITYINNTLIYCVPNKGLRMLNLNDDSVSDVFIGEMSEDAYVASSRDKLYYTNSDTHTVTCCDLHGNTQWQFLDESILKYPYGITVDSDGNVYVVSRPYRKVVVISSDGTQGRQLLSLDDGLKHPQAIHYDISTNRLLVANEKNIAFLFKVAKSK